MKRIKVIKRYSDVALGKIVEKGTEMEVEDKRAVHLVHEGMAEIIDETKPAKPAKAEGK